MAFKRSKMSKQKSRKLFKKTANSTHRKNGYGTLPRGGEAL